MWIPSTPSVYYVRVRPFSDSSTTRCEARYRLMILAVRSQIFLPVVMRDYQAP